MAAASCNAVFPQSPLQVAAPSFVCSADALGLLSVTLAVPVPHITASPLCVRVPYLPPGGVQRRGAVRLTVPGHQAAAGCRRLAVRQGGAVAAAAVGLLQPLSGGGQGTGAVWGTNKGCGVTGFSKG